MSNGGGILGGFIVLFVGIIFIFVGITIVNITPDEQFEQGSIEELLVEIPDAIGWGCILGGALVLLMGFLVILASAKS